MKKGMTDLDYITGIRDLILKNGSVTVTDVINKYQGLYADDAITYLNELVGDGITEDKENNAWVVFE